MPIKKKKPPAGKVHAQMRREKKARFIARMKKGREEAAKRRTGNRAGSRRVSKRTKRERKIVRATRQRIVYRRQHGAPARSETRGLPNPRGRHLPGLAAKYQRMYEDVLAAARTDKRYKGREKEVAARTVEAAAHRQPNPYPALLKRATAKRRRGSRNGKRAATRGTGSRNPGVIRFSESQARRYSGKIPGLGSTPKKKKSVAGSKRARKPKATKKRGGLLRRAGRNWLAGMRTMGGVSAVARSRRNTTRRRNETPQGIQAIHEKFLGRPSRKSFTIVAPKGTPADVAVLGGLVELKSQTETFGFAPGEAHLGADPNGRMFVLGNVRAEPHHDFGELVELSYTARKAHLDDKLIEYFHRFREDGGIPPKLTTDAEGAFHILGGSYTIERAGITR